MKIGIIIVTYNSQKDITRILESIITQKNENLVVYIVDNNSKDETLKIVQIYQSKIAICIISSQVNNGFARGNNIGIQKAIDDASKRGILGEDIFGIKGKNFSLRITEFLNEQ